MTPPDKQKRVMALDVRSRRFGFAIFEGPNELLDCGVRGFRTRVVTVQVPPRQKLATLFDDFNVAVVVWRGPASRTSARKSSIGHALQRESLVRRIPVRLVTRGAVKKVFAGSNGNKYEIASALAQRLPALASKLPSKRKCWQSEVHRMSMFDAAALAIAYFARLEGRGPATSGELAGQRLQSI